MANTTRPVALKALVPSGVLARYIPREIGGVGDMELFKYAMDNKMNILIEGPTGAAKTMMLRAFAEKHGLAFVNVKCSGGADPDALFGTVDVVDGNTVFKPGDLTLAAMYGNAVINLDEINAMPNRLTFVFHDAFDDRRSLSIPGAAGSEGGSLTVPIADNVLIVGAYNEGYGGTNDLNAAFANRFHLKIQMDYDADAEKYLVASPTLLKIAKYLRTAVKAGDLETPVSTNRLMTFETLVHDLGFDFAVENFVNQFGSDERETVREQFRNADGALAREYNLVDVAVDPNEGTGGD